MTNNLYGLLRGVNSHIHTGLKLTTDKNLIYGAYNSTVIIHRISHSHSHPTLKTHTRTLSMVGLWVYFSCRVIYPMDHIFYLNLAIVDGTSGA